MWYLYVKVFEYEVSSNMDNYEKTFTKADYNI